MNIIIKEVQNDDEEIKSVQNFLYKTIYAFLQK